MQNSSSCGLKARTGQEEVQLKETNTVQCAQLEPKRKIMLCMYPTPNEKAQAQGTLKNADRDRPTTTSKLA